MIVEVLRVVTIFRDVNEYKFGKYISIFINEGRKEENVRGIG